MLIDDRKIHLVLQKIVARLTTDEMLQDDLMQECLVRLWNIERDEPGRTRSWYLQNCRFHLLHWLDSGRSLDSLKRIDGNNRVTIDGVSDEVPLDGCEPYGELLAQVNANDIVSALTSRLRPLESAVLKGLAEGMVLRDIALKLHLSYPTALKYRRKIAAMTMKLGIWPARWRRMSGRRVADAGEPI